MELDAPPPPPPPVASSDVPPQPESGLFDGIAPVPPPAAAAAVPPTQPLHRQPNPRRPRRSGWAPGDSDESGSDHSSDGEGEEEKPWQPITEDVTVPCEDELEFLVSKGEHSALNHEYWEKEAFFELRDPELIPGESGRIDWLLEGFNGTKDKPNNEILMRSQVVRIGGLDWQIKFYPKGNGSQYLSLYIECISMLEPDYAATEDFQTPPFPFLKGTEQLRKCRSVAAQLLVVMYNPAEPRVYEVQSEAHQFSKKQADYGWVYFSKHPRSEFHHRQHTQRQAILQNDQLAFKAFIRVVEDPTGSMWGHHPTSPEDIISLTGLRPFKKSLQYVAGVVPLLHFAPFRKLVQDLAPETQLARWLQPLLLKMYTRRLSLTYNERAQVNEGDVMEILMKISVLFHSENTSELTKQWEDVVGLFPGSVCGANRLNTKDYPSIQDAVDHHPKSIARSQLLTLELTRQEHDKKGRKWKKLTNRVRVEDNIEVEGSRYTLFAFVTHCGHLMSSQYNSYVRPNGIGNGWYGYEDGLVLRLTEKQASDMHSGTDPEDKQHGHDSPFSDIHKPQSEVSSVVMYVRDDVAADTFEAPSVETWTAPLSVRSLPSLPKEVSKNEATTPLEDVKVSDTPEDRSSANLGSAEEGEAPFAGWIDRETGAATPQPTRMDGEDTIMRDGDEDSVRSIDDIGSDPTDGTALEIGTFSWLGRCHYEGQWKDGLYHGGGFHIDTNGDEYLGRFERGLKHGYGKMIYASTGDIYEGNWSEGRHDGQGTLTELSSGNVFEGGWKEGRKHGSFLLRGTVTEEDKSCCTICYEEEISTAFYDCGHVVACRSCAAKIDTCPVCRRRVAATLQLYGVKLSSH